ncbi:hypothetical protein, partial [Cohnella sp. GCM10012308]|uniref:hypothetical protein n=1 Tax=Cohnella sp. GCM10012308 TaxID=3317329 RepID=UPI00360F149E
VGWLCLAHNLLKKVAIDQKRKRDEAGNSPASSRLAISASFQLFASTSKGFWDSPFLPERVVLDEIRCIFAGVAVKERRRRRLVSLSEMRSDEPAAGVPTQIANHKPQTANRKSGFGYLPNRQTAKPPNRQTAKPPSGRSAISPDGFFAREILHLCRKVTIVH